MPVIERTCFVPIINIVTNITVLSTFFQANQSVNTTIKRDPIKTSLRPVLHLFLNIGSRRLIFPYILNLILKNFNILSKFSGYPNTGLPIKETSEH